MQPINRKSEIFSGATVGDKTGFDFTNLGNKRKIRYLFLFLPPCKKTDSKFQYMYLAWKYMSLKETGWGPPACMARKDNVQD